MGHTIREKEKLLNRVRRVRGQVEAQHLGNTAQSELAGAVGRMPGQGDQPGRRGHID